MEAVTLAATQSSARTGTGRDDWQTPECVLERVRRVDNITLDPCTSRDNPVGADSHIWWPDGDGLAVDWRDHLTAIVRRGVVYVNPPYSKMAGWADKVAFEAQHGCPEIITLAAARPDCRWFSRLAWSSAQAVCFWKGRLRFVGAPSSAPFPSAVVYHGARPWAFEEAFHDAGKVVRL